MRAFASAILMLAAAITAKAQHTIWFDEPCTSERPFPWIQEDEPDYDGKQSSAGTMSFNAQWEARSLPIGNGSIGANVMGSVAVERLTLNEKTLWLGGPGVQAGPQRYWNVNKEGWKVLPQVREALAKGDLKKADRILETNFNAAAGAEDRDSAYGNLFGTYTTLGELTVETGLDEGSISGYSRSLNIDDALARVCFKAGGASYERTFFASYPANIIAARFRSDAKQNLVIRYTHSPLAEGDTSRDSSGGICFHGHLLDNGQEFAVRVKVKAKGGSVRVEDGCIRAEGAECVDIFLTADTDYKLNLDPDKNDPKAYAGVDPMATTAGWMKEAGSWERLLGAHISDYRKLFGRVDFHLEGPSSGLPTDERLEAYRNGNKDQGLEELYFHFGRYLLIACSRPGNMPANLQGIWLQNTDAPWMSDYHNNINIQMNYWPALQDNLAECAQPLTDYIKMLRKPGAETARAYWNARGWAASISTNIYGYAAPMPGESVSWNYNPVAASWLATHLWEYYDFTRDEKFLRETAYPLIKDCAEFCEDFLWMSPEGFYMANPSSSPEHGHADEGTTFAHAVIREILLDAICAAEVLGTDAEARSTWKSILDKLYPYKIGRYGQLLEWSKDIDDPDDNHRHVNHLYGLHPGRTISPITTPELAQASKVVLEHRGDESTGWSIGWKLCQWARLHDGDHSYTLYQSLLKNGTADNLWDIHPPFQIDGNFGGIAGVTEMLLQSQDGCINLLPSLPTAWPSGHIKGLKARGNFTVDIEWKDGRLTKAVITSGSGLPFTVRYGEKTQSFQLKKGKSAEISFR